MKKAIQPIVPPLRAPSALVRCTLPLRPQAGASVVLTRTPAPPCGALVWADRVKEHLHEVHRCELIRPHEAFEPVVAAGHDGNLTERRRRAGWRR